MKEVIVADKDSDYKTLDEAIDAEIKNMHWFRRIACKVFPKWFGVRLHIRSSEPGWKSYKQMN